MKTKPNVLWICTDSQRYDTLGCTGNRFVHTPNLDELAQHGTLFTNVFAQNPLCSPSRGCFMTGRYPSTMGLRQNGQNINDDELLVTRTLADSGYHCGLVGKLHLSACDNRIKNCGPDWWKEDAEKFFNYDGQERRINDGYREFVWDHAPNPMFRASAYTQWLESCGQTYRSEELVGIDGFEDCKQVEIGMDEEFHQTTFCVNESIDFIQSRITEHDQPWLLSINIFDPHFPFNPPRKYFERYLDIIEEIDVSDITDDYFNNRPEYQREYFHTKNSTRELTKHDKQCIKAAYYAMIDQIDAQLGRLFSFLKETKEIENTVIIFTSDHGELLGDHGLLKKGGILCDSSLHVPLIIYNPTKGQNTADTNSELIELGQLAPTVLEACGLQPTNNMQLHSFWHDGDLKYKNERGYVFAEYMNSNPDKSPQYLSMIRTKDYKLIWHHKQDMHELYDLVNDPGETVNLYYELNNPRHKRAFDELVSKLLDELAMHCDPNPPRIGIY